MCPPSAPKSLQNLQGPPAHDQLLSLRSQMLDLKSEEENGSQPSILPSPTAQPSKVVSDAATTAEKLEPQEAQADQGNELLDAIMERESVKKSAGTSKTAALPTIKKHAIQDEELVSAKRAKLQKSSATTEKSVKKANPGTPRPSISHEASRSQFQCRTGKSGKGQNFAIKYGTGYDHKTEKQGRAAAEKWLQQKKGSP